VLGVGALAGAFYVMYLGYTVTRTFEGRRWTLPAQVFAAPLELYAGLALTPGDLVHELERLHYRRVTQLERPGTYRVSGERIDVALRPARFADETRDALLIGITTAAGGIVGIKDAGGQDLPVIRL
jgi:penicillin-binding protein 1B